MTRAFVKCTKARRLKKRNMRTVSADPGRLGSAGLPPPLPLGPRGPLGPDFSVLSTALGSLDPVSHFTSETPANAACSTDGVWDTQGRSWAGGRASSPVPLLGPPGLCCARLSSPLSAVVASLHERRPQPDSVTETLSLATLGFDLHLDGAKPASSRAPCICGFCVLGSRLTALRWSALLLVHLATSIPRI